MSGLLGFEHIGMTSSDAEATIAFYCDLLGLRLVLRKSQPSGELLFLDAGGGMLEIMVPADGSLNRSHDVLPTEAGMRHMTFAFEDVLSVCSTIHQIQLGHDCKCSLSSWVYFLSRPDKTRAQQ